MFRVISSILVQARTDDIRTRQLHGQPNHLVYRANVSDA